MRRTTRRTQSFSVDDGVEYADPESEGERQLARTSIQTGGATFEGAEFELPGPQRARRGGPHPGDARAASSSSTSALHHLPGRQRRLGAAGRRYRHQPARRPRHRPRRAAGLQGRADSVHAVHLVSGRQRAQVGLPVSDARHLLAQRHVAVGARGTGTSRRTTTRRSLPTWYSKRGGKLDTEFRYLTDLGRGTLDCRVPARRPASSATRAACVRFVDQSDFTDTLRLDIDAANVSDSDWFEDFGLGPEGTSVTLSESLGQPHLPRRALAGGRCARRTSRRSTTAASRPSCGRTPCCRSWRCTPRFPDQPGGLRFGLDVELGELRAQLRRPALQTGWRVDVAPEVRMPLRGAGVYLEPAASWRYTAYRLDDTGAPAATIRPAAPRRS